MSDPRFGQPTSETAASGLSAETVAPVSPLDSSSTIGSRQSSQTIRDIRETSVASDGTISQDFSRSRNADPSINYDVTAARPQNLPTNANVQTDAAAAANDVTPTAGDDIPHPAPQLSYTQVPNVAPDLYTPAADNIYTEAERDEDANPPHQSLLDMSEIFSLAPEIGELQKVMAELFDDETEGAKSTPLVQTHAPRGSKANVLPLKEDASNSRRFPNVKTKPPPANVQQPAAKPKQRPTPIPRPRKATPANKTGQANVANQNLPQNKPAKIGGTKNLAATTNQPTVPPAQNQNVPLRRTADQGFTMSEGVMDGQGNIIAEEEKEAMRQYQLFIQRGKLKEQKGKTNESIVDFQKALEYEIKAKGAESRDVAKTHGLLGRVLHKAGRHREAVEQLKKELHIYEGYPYSDENKKVGDIWQVHDILAQAYDGLNETSKEIEHYETAISILVESATVPPERLPHMHNNVGNACRNVGKLNEARSHLEQAKEMMLLMHGDDPVEDMAKVHASLGDIYVDLNLTREAIKELEACIIIREKTRPGPDGELLRGGTHQTLASLYEAVGDNEKAQYHTARSKQGLKGLMGSKEEREVLLDNLAGMVKGRNASGVLGRLAAGLTASDDINKAQTYQASGDNKKAIEHYEKGIESLTQLPEDVQNSEELLSTLALCYNNVGNAYRKTNQWDLAEKRLRDALKVRRRLFADEASEDTGSTLFNLGHLLQGIGGRTKTLEALDLHKECLDMYLKLDNGTNKHKTWIVSLYRGLGVGYERLSNSRMSIQMYEKAKELLTEPGDEDELRAVCNNVGNSYESIGDFRNAEKNISEALNMAAILAIDKPDDTDIQNHIAAGHNNLGVLYQTWGKLDKALYHLNQSLEIRETIKDFNMEAAHDVASSHHNIGNTLAKQGDLQGALDSYNRELKIRMDLGTDTTGVRVSLSQIYEKLGDTAKAEEILIGN